MAYNSKKQVLKTANVIGGSGIGIRKGCAPLLFGPLGISMTFPRLLFNITHNAKSSVPTWWYVRSSDLLFIDY